MPRGTASSTPGSLMLDATSQAMELPAWDEEEQRIIQAVARRLRLITILNQDGDPQISTLARKSLEDLAAWWRGDQQENTRHTGILGLLQRANGLLDRFRRAA